MSVTASIPRAARAVVGAPAWLLILVSGIAAMHAVGVTIAWYERGASAAFAVACPTLGLPFVLGALS